METKQFPEKWAVRGSQEFAEFVTRQGIKQELWAGDDKSSFYYNDFGTLQVCAGIPDGYTEVTLEDLIAHYEPATHPKWMPLTRGGYEYKVCEEFGNKLFGRINKGSQWMPTAWYLGGNCINNIHEDSLILYSSRIAELEEKITSKRSELAELEGELNTLKGK